MRSGPARLQNLTLTVLGAAVVALVAINWWVLGINLADSADVRAPAAAKAAQALTLLPPPVGPSSSEFAEIVQRPVFYASRRPRETVNSAGNAGDANAPDIRLTGIVIGGDKKRALLRVSQQPESLWVDEGGSIEGWRVVNVRDDAVTIVTGRRTFELRLYPSQSPQAR
jgi:hypothetical protein